MENDMRISRHKEIRWDLPVTRFQERKLQLYKAITENKNVRDDTRSGLPIIDPLIFPLVWHINQYQGLRTTQSCQGHTGKNILLRQGWRGKDSPIDSAAHISFCANDFVDRHKLFDLMYSITSEDFIQTNILITCSCPDYCIWWEKYNTLEDMDKIMKYIAGLGLELDPSVEAYRYLLDRVQGEWCKPKWVLR